MDISKKIKQVGCYKVILFSLLLIQFIFLIKVRFTAWPEMLAWPYLMLAGWLPYRDIAIAHTPLLLADLAIFNTIFGIGLSQLKVYTWILILITDFLLYFVAGKLWNKKIALIALIFYIPLQILYEGNGLWFDLALAPFAILIYYSFKSKKYFWLGFLFGLAILTKQTAVWLVVPILYTLQGLAFKGVKNYIIDIARGIFIPLSIFFVILFFFGLHIYFYKWAIEFGIFYLPGAEGQVLLPTLKQLVVSLFPFVILTPLIFWNKRKDFDLIVWTFFAVMGVYPRFELFHFQPALPFLAIGGGIVILSLLKNLKAVFKFLFLGYVVIMIFLFTRYLSGNLGEEARFYGQDEINISSFVKSSIEKDRKIYVLNYWDSIYAMTDTLPAVRPLVPYLSWYLEYDGSKETIRKDLYLDMPKVVVKGDYSQEGLGSYKVDEIDELLQRYYALSYKSGGVEVYSLNK